MFARHTAFLLGFFFLTQVATAKGSVGRFKPILKFEDIHYSHISIVKSVTGIWRMGDNLFTTGKTPNFFITPINTPPKGYDPLLDIAPSEKIVIPTADPTHEWLPMGELVEDKVMLFNKNNLKIYLFNKKDWSVIETKDLVVDQLKPAKDARGEPTKKETGALQTKLRLFYNKTKDDLALIKSIASLPVDKREKDAHQFVALTSFPDHPVVTMTCSAKLPLYCKLERACFTRLPAGVALKDLQGISFSEKRHTLFIGNTTEHRLEAFTYNSCFDVVHSGKMDYSVKLKRLQALHIDHTDGLWFATAEPDDYRNGSVYFWLAKDW
ncbi:MAG: hypothetical protein AB7T49_04610 [Oligoflexales bacterium]